MKLNLDRTDAWLLSAVAVLAFAKAFCSAPIPWWAVFLPVLAPWGAFLLMAGLTMAYVLASVALHVAAEAFNARLKK
jgi:hypothetical protein